MNDVVKELLKFFLHYLSIAIHIYLLKQNLLFFFAKVVENIHESLQLYVALFVLVEVIKKLAYRCL